MKNELAEISLDCFKMGSCCSLQTVLNIHPSSSVKRASTETAVDVIACNTSRTNNTQEFVVTTELLQTSIISRAIVSEFNDYKHSELSGKDKDLVVKYWHFVEDHLDEVGAAAYIDLFKVSPELKKIFEFLHNYDPDDDKFYELVAKHSLRVFGLLNKLVKELHDKTSEEVNECIHSFIYPLGRRHHVYGPNVIQVELLGLLMAKSLLTFIPIDKVGDQKFEDITHAFFSFFKVIVYWLKFGLNQQKRLSL